MKAKIIYTVLAAGALFSTAAMADGVIAGWAVVGSAGHILHGSGVSASTHPETGTYHVKFATDVSQCAYLGSILGPAKDAFPGTVVLRNFKPNVVKVLTFENNT